MSSGLDVVEGILKLLDELRQTYGEVKCTVIYSNDELTKILKKQFDNDENISLCHTIDLPNMLPVDKTKVYVIHEKDKFHRFVI